MRHRTIPDVSEYPKPERKTDARKKTPGQARGPLFANRKARVLVVVLAESDGGEFTKRLQQLFRVLDSTGRFVTEHVQRIANA